MNTQKHHGLWTLFWIGLAILCNIMIFIFRGNQAGMEFLMGYILEKSLSIDNLFVFYLIFSSLKITPRLQRKVLYLGIIGAFVLRGVFIYSSLALIERFQFLITLLGIILFFTGIQFLRSKNKKSETKPPFLSFTRSMKSKFWAAVLLVELTDVVFALDSIPAILSISRDPFIIYSSNLFAILGLRSLYFFLEDKVKKFKFIKTALAFILIFIGGKMTLEHWFHIPTEISLGVIFAILGITAGLDHLKKLKKGSRAFF